jgi:peptidoglycan/LPS O-acetylase OafA/YrhL
LAIKRINNIQCLRAFAAIAVICFHLVAAARIYNNPVVTEDFFLRLGSSGVDVFFVISGFIMVHTQVNRRRTASDFFVNRLIRIVPVYWTLSLAIGVMLLIVPEVFGSQSFSASRVFSSLTFTSISFSSQPPLIFIGWTIELEMTFYALFAISLMFKKISTSVLCASVGILFLVFVCNFSTILIEFIFGMLIGLFVRDKRVSPSWNWTALVLAGAGFAISAVFDLASVERVIKWGIPAFLLVFGVIGINQLRKTFLVEIGNASYSIYLVQVFVIPATYKIVGRMNLAQFSEVWAVMCLMLTIGAGFVVHRVIELPITNRLQKWRTVTQHNELPANTKLEM